MRKLLFLEAVRILVPGLAILAALVAETPVYADSIEVGYFLLPPLVMETPDGSAAGAAVSLFRKLADEMGVETITLRPYPLKRLLRSLQQGAVDAALTLGRNPDRAEKFVYPETPYFEMQSALVVSRDHPLTEIHSSKDLRGLRIGVFADGFLTPLLQETELDREPITDSDVVGRALEMVNAGHLDAFFSPNETSVEFRIQQGGLEDRLRIVRLPEPPTGLYTVFSRPGAERFLERYQAAFKKLWSPKVMRDHLLQAMQPEGAAAGPPPEKTP
jgi:ABC-type amino acid transport substrate-binding protein